MNLKDLADRGIIFVVAKVEIEYKAPARYQDMIRILTRVERTKISMVQFYQKVSKDDALISEARTTLICVGSNLRPLSIPDEIKRVLSL
jgi:acyl-CoA thioester hydrolase